LPPWRVPPPTNHFPYLFGMMWHPVTSPDTSPHSIRVFQRRTYIVFASVVLLIGCFVMANFRSKTVQNFCDFGSPKYVSYYQISYRTTYKQTTIPPIHPSANLYRNLYCLHIFFGIVRNSYDFLKTNDPRQILPRSPRANCPKFDLMLSRHWPSTLTRHRWISSANFCHWKNCYECCLMYPVICLIVYDDSRSVSVLFRLPNKKGLIDRRTAYTTTLFCRSD
jgi:hypothetical protein